MSLIACRASGTTVTDLVTLGTVQPPRHGVLVGGWGVGMACSTRGTAEARANAPSKRAGAHQAEAALHRR